ncbi:phosphatidylinositol-specific phospholipase C [Myroides sp. NP-2]|uniref:phosphatidylinositol-specific phospholipase C n=1 Tax=Myroides sp. NP-2 TaxID=2759945 RepID=UPI0015FCC6A2|nr:phosphatidylinositol-specific phospholipase C [Myroides sp. NP-2]MBB1149039.1 phosphatidylinositol-specific phospholipase C [Myroides sp. NP-2]
MRYSLLSDTRNWMSCIEDNKSIAHMSIPGTHDSCARKDASGQAPGIDEYVAAQHADRTIVKQLEDGIRYLDIRCCVIDGVFTIHHGEFYLNINFGDVLKQCVDFLNTNITETIIMRIKQENSSVSDEEFLTVFNTQYAGYHGSMYLETAIPELGTVRGKIVILSNVSSLPGIPYNSIQVQDDYTDTSVSSKRAKINDFAIQSVNVNRNDGNPSLCLNHCSATNPPLVSPASLAAVLLPQITRDFKEGLGAQYVDNSQNEAPHMGIVAMDFYTNDLVTEIIKRNENKDFKDLPVYSIYNSYYGRHYFYASMYMDSAMKRRQVFGWSPGGQVTNGYWMLIPSGSNNEYYIFNTYYKEFLYASSFVEENRRTVYTWADAVPTAESIWTITNNTIYNVHYACYLYESSLTYSEDRKLVPCWAPSVSVAQDQWTMVLENKSV